MSIISPNGERPTVTGNTSGYSIDLDDNRSVFASTTSKPDVYGFRFTNQGHITDIAFSLDSIVAMVDLVEKLREPPQPKEPAHER